MIIDVLGSACSQPSTCRKQQLVPWQPLSLEALQQYKQSMDALGNGAFNTGAAPMWSVAAVN